MGRTGGEGDDGGEAAECRVDGKGGGGVKGGEVRDRGGH